MSIVSESFSRLFPDKSLDKEPKIKYSNKFKDYNANVRITSSALIFSLSRKWKTIDKEIKIGLIQTLLLKIYKEKRKTTNISLYISFIKNLHITVPKSHSHPALKESFNRINNAFFYNLVETPNLEWGSTTTAKLGSYDFHTDTITISSIFLNHHNLLDYVMYHEVLHKKLKFRNSGSKTFHHTKEFKDKEKEFPNAELLERMMKQLASRARIKSQNKRFLNSLIPRIFR